jgi:hypothetical protein
MKLLLLLPEIVLFIYIAVYFILQMHLLRIVNPGGDIQKALDSAPTGGTIFIETGTYELDSALKVTKPCKIIGREPKRPKINIDDCFAIDIDSNNVAICNLRLWTWR